MTPEDIAQILKLFFLGWLGALTAIILVKMLRGDINTTGLMCSANSDEPDPERVTLVMLTVGVALFYLVHTLGVPLSEITDADGKVTMPDLPDEALVLLGGSQGAYITGKIMRPTKGV